MTDLARLILLIAAPAYTTWLAARYTPNHRIRLLAGAIAFAWTGIVLA